jgi:hypothetical protein
MLPITSNLTGAAVDRRSAEQWITVYLVLPFSTQIFGKIEVYPWILYITSSVLRLQSLRGVPDCLHLGRPSADVAKVCPVPCPGGKRSRGPKIGSVSGSNSTRTLFFINIPMDRDQVLNLVALITEDSINFASPMAALVLGGRFSSTQDPWKRKIKDGKEKSIDPLLSRNSNACDPAPHSKSPLIFKPCSISMFLPHYRSDIGYPGQDGPGKSKPFRRV